MKTLLFLSLLLLWRLPLYAQHREENLILNPDFETIIYDFSSNIKRVDVPHAKPLHWEGRSTQGLQVFQVRDTPMTACMPNKKTKKRSSSLHQRSPIACLFWGCGQEHKSR
jgi:hypothetical protein